jgi:4-hydroxy-2-oxoheptanedioate aldolase
MTAPVLAERLRAGETLLSGWSTLPEPFVAEALARGGFDCVTFDQQHGMHDTASVMRGISAVSHMGKPSLVRIPVGDNAFASRALDMGAEAIIAPMINNAEEARALVAATKYPPIGERSWGPPRALILRGHEPQAHLEMGNRVTVTIAMIETDQALGALDDILSVPGIDGVFVGPSDLSITMSDGAKVAAMDPMLDDALAMIADKANAARKIAGAYAATGERAAYFRSLGYRLIGLGSDVVCLAAGSRSFLAASKA